MVPITLIAAVNKQRVIGHANELLYDIPEDMAFFKEVTTDGIVIMGRNTYDSIGQPLKNRINFVVTSKTEELQSRPENGSTLFVVSDLRRALDMARAMAVLRKLPTVYVIGGSQIYSACMIMTDCLLLTEIDDDTSGDSYFPPYPSTEWREVGRSDMLKSERNPDAPQFQFVTYER